MASYSIAEARDRFSALVDAAERGEPVRITRYGRSVVRIVPDVPEPDVVRGGTWETLEPVLKSLEHIRFTDIAHRSLVEEMRNEDW